MDNLQLHAEGNQSHFQILKEKYQALKQEVKEDKTLSASQKNSELEALKTAFEKEKKETKSNLYWFL